MKPFIPYRYSRFVVAAILFFSALTKAHLTATEPSDKIEWFAMGTVLFESALALALALGLFPRWIKYTAITVFSVFFCVAVDLALKAASSCGCFGHVHVDPKITACLDIAVVLLLLFSKHENPAAKTRRRQIILFCIGMALFSLLLIPMSMHPPVTRIEHQVEDKPVQDEMQVTENLSVVYPEVVEIGFSEPKTVHRFTIDINNQSGKEWTIDEIRTECECIAVIKSPSKVPARAKTPIVFEFTAPDISGPYTKTITITADGKTWQSRLKARINHPLTVEPETLYYAKEGSETEKTFMITNDGNTPVKILYAVTTPPEASVIVDAKSIEPRTSKEFKAILKDPGQMQDFTITIHTGHRHQKTIRINVSAEK